MRLDYTKVKSAIKNRIKRIVYRIQGKKIVHFLHIGKTGGTAVKHVLSKSLKLDDYVIVLHPHRISLRDIPVGDKVIFFLRDPITRFVSGFYSCQRQGKPRYNSPWSEKERLAFDVFKTPNELALALSSLDDQKRLAAIKAMKTIEHVRDHYSQWLESGVYLEERINDVMFIGFQENMQKNFEELKNILGLPYEEELPKDDILAHKNPKDLDKRLDKKAIENLQSWYHDDLVLLKQCQAMSIKLEGTSK